MDDASIHPFGIFVRGAYFVDIILSLLSPAIASVHITSILERAATTRG
jgi:hypothetical protein